MYDTMRDALRFVPTHTLTQSLVLEAIYSGDEPLLFAERQLENLYVNAVHPQKRSPYLNGGIGQTAEAVASLILFQEYSWMIVDQTTGAYPGSHGVDLLSYHLMISSMPLK